MKHTPNKPTWIPVRQLDIMQAGDEYKPYHWYGWTPIPADWHGLRKGKKVGYRCPMRRPNNIKPTPDQLDRLIDVVRNNMEWKENKMKLNIEVEIDWMGDENGGTTPDQIVKGEIVNAIVNKLSDGFKKQVENEAMILVREKLNIHVNEMLQNFMTRPVVITDRYGDVKERHENVNEMVKEQFDNFLIERVDKDGRPVKESCGYGNSTFTRIDWTIERKVTSQAQDFMKKVVEQVDAQLKKSLDAAVREKVSAALMAKLDLSGVIK